MLISVVVQQAMASQSVEYLQDEERRGKRHKMTRLHPAAVEIVSTTNHSLVHHPMHHHNLLVRLHHALVALST